MSKPYLSLIIPVRDESKTVLQTLISVDYALSISEFSSEVIVSDDGSRDTTPNIVLQYEKVLKPLKCIEGKSRRGFGQAINDGMNAANGNVRVIMYPSCVGFLDKREDILSAFKEGYDIVVGSRNIGTGKLSLKRGVKKAFRKLSNKLMCGKELRGISDVSFGAVCMTEEMSDWLFSFPELSDSSNIFFDIYMLAYSNGARIKEIEYSDSDLCACRSGVWSWVSAFFHSVGARRRAAKKKKIDALILE
ncbi:MAG: glycosyltransferase [Candidatus Jorgensenbacteria bacterium]|nr:glycosyltransferase [Candidatus Jorgensenbacteria bacterium]